MLTACCYPAIFLMFQKDKNKTLEREKKIRNDRRNQFSANTNNINEESDNNGLKYVYGYLNGEKIKCLLDRASVKTLKKIRKGGPWTVWNGDEFDVVLRI
ncbi:hypothetical protein BpHYR1_010845 [Brachionus plicatilis]|uniref:Uncharacterized protein n=1 Tax=Brachionus plicatilis TaxID=10195 RepID=A0A3M7RWH8_BRAPC|nr:hypothetical protein BpHYR1_010845 [Brachionus plicatilis]